MIRPLTSHPLKLQLGRNLVKTIKRGHAWVYADALRHLPSASPGSPAVLYDNRGGRAIARGYYDPGSPIAFRVCSTNPDEHLDQTWAVTQMEAAVSLRSSFDFPGLQTTAFRLFNGEGDALPGLVCDVYSEYAVLVTDVVPHGR